MIFITVGTQLPFERLLRGIDGWAGRNQGVPILAQVGGSSGHFPNIQTISHLSQAAFQDQLKETRLVVAHAGMGTILSASELGLPIILMPRLAKFGEHRNDHQQDTAREMVRLSNVTVVEDGESLHRALDLARARNFELPRPESTEMSRELDPLIHAIKDFVWSNTTSFPLNATATGNEVA